MGDREEKGFKVVDKRGMSDEERQQAAPPPPAPPPKAEGNKTGAGDVHGSNSPEGIRAGGVGSPTFLDLVSTLQLGVMVNLGMVQSPDGKRPPVNLPAAKDSIDILGVLQEKTKGNLNDEEAGVLTEGLYHLRMAYMAAMNAGRKSGGKGT